ncbi:MAG: hypothetical protein LBF57_00565 [Holosporaceae bacterium]|nr:hypothetical protein [Holosporaceae bacterium]
MKQALTPEDINFLKEKIRLVSAAPWNVIEDNHVETGPLHRRKSYSAFRL